MLRKFSARWRKEDVCCWRRSICLNNPHVYFCPKNFFLLTEAVLNPRRYVPNDVDCLPSPLGLEQHGVEPVEVLRGVVKVEQEPEVEVVAEVGVDGDKAEARADQSVEVAAFPHVPLHGGKDFMRVTCFGHLLAKVAISNSSSLLFRKHKNIFTNCFSYGLSVSRTFPNAWNQVLTQGEGLYSTAGLKPSPKFSEYYGK